jgi:hypothetical protein
LITSTSHYEWLLDPVYLVIAAQAFGGQFLDISEEFPPRQKPASFSLDPDMETPAPPTP